MEFALLGIKEPGTGSSAFTRFTKYHQAGRPDLVEEWKWRGVPVWEHDGIICTGETYKAIVKMTFARGASLDDPSGLFNSSLEGNTRRAFDIHEGDRIDEKATDRHSCRADSHIEHFEASRSAARSRAEAREERLKPNRIRSASSRDAFRADEGWRGPAR